MGYVLIVPVQIVVAVNFAETNQSLVGLGGLNSAVKSGNVLTSATAVSYML